MIMGNYPGITEVEAGSYVFMDAKYSAIEGLEAYGNALTVLTTIISRPTPEKAICDAGLKTLAFEFGTPVVKGREDILYERPSDEHGRLKVDPSSRLKTGDKIELIVTHCCSNTNLFDYFHCIRDGSLEALWRVEARGKSQ